jgi:hypothetical protein
LAIHLLHCMPQEWHTEAVIDLMLARGKIMVTATFHMVPESCGLLGMADPHLLDSFCESRDVAIHGCKHQSRSLGEMQLCVILQCFYCCFCNSSCADHRSKQ